MFFNVKQIFQELVVPELREIKSEVKVLHIEIKRLDEKIDARGDELDGKIDALGDELDEKIDALGIRLDEKIDAQGARLDDKISSLRNEMLSLRNEMLSEFRRLDERVDVTVQVRERLISLETRIAAYENRN